MNYKDLEKLHPESEIYIKRLITIQEQEKNLTTLKLNKKDIKIILRVLSDAIVNGGFNSNSKDLIKNAYVHINKQLQIRA